MTTPYLQGGAAAPENTALKLRGVQTDAFGEILGGHKALYDPMQSGLTGVLASNAQVPNIVRGGAPMMAVSAFTGTTAMEVARGINFGTGNGDQTRLPDAFDLRTLGAEPSLIISTWLTQTVDSGTSMAAIMGFAYQTGSQGQWYLSHNNVAGQLRFGCSTSVNSTAIPITDGVPTLLTFHFRRTGPGAFVAETYTGSTRIGSLSRNYPFVDVVNVAAGRALGYIAGFATTWQGTIHRLQLIKVTQDFAIARWLDAEIAANGVRWT